MRAIGNMDETPMFFDMPGNRTVDVKGASTVSIKTSGAEKQHFTVILSCLADVLRNGSASDSRSEGCVFESRRAQHYF